MPKKSSICQNGAKENQKEAVSAALAALCYAFFYENANKVRGFWFSCDFLDSPPQGQACPFKKMEIQVDSDSRFFIFRLLMNCCNHVTCTTGIDDFFSKEAQKFLKRFKKRGLEKSQKNLFAGLEKSGINDKSILEIGCGVGYLHGQLIQHGAKNATGVDISEEMIRYAKSYMQEIGLDQKTQYHKGDFAEISAEINSADITILDKVICCYPEAENLVERSINKTREIYAFTLPRNVWWVKYSIMTVIRIMKIFRSAFHPYFHNHELVNSRLLNQGFHKVYQNHTMAWETYVYKKQG